MRLLQLLLLSVLSTFALRAHAEPISIRVATVAPSGSHWHNELKKLNTAWKDISGGEVSLKIYVGAAMGDEGDIVGKLRAGLLEGAVLSSEGLHDLAPESIALDLPLQLRSDKEYDAVAAKVLPSVNEALVAKGFVPLGWSQVGWLHLFTGSSRATLTEARASKLWVAAGDPSLQKFWKDAGFNPVNLSYVDMLPSLATGMIDATTLVPTLALANNVSTKLQYMLALPLASQSAGFIITKSAWDKVPADLRPKLADVVEATAAKLTKASRAQAVAATAKLKSLGVTIVAPGSVDEWSKLMMTLQTTSLRGKRIPEATFDLVAKAIAAVRAGLK